MKVIVTLLATVAVVNAFTCPATPAINTACTAIGVVPLLCSNPKVNVAACNEKQCTQTYIDNYAACQCRRSPTLFYEHSVNVDGLLRRCGVAGLTNPFGNPYQYRPGQGTQTFSASGGSGIATTIAQPIEATSATPVPTVVPVAQQDYYMSGGAIAGTVLGSLAAFAFAGLLGFCWRKERAQHAALYSNPSTNSVDTNVARAPSRTVVTEKIEPVVVRSVPTTNTHVVPPGMTTYSNPSSNTYNSTNSGYNGNNTNAGYNANSTNTGYNSNNTNTGYNTNNTNTGYDSNNTVPVNTYSSASNPTYNTTTNANTGYNTQPRAGGVLDSDSNGVHNAANGTGNAVSHGVNSADNTVGNAIHGTSHSAGNTMH
ncbi:hypothetical protein KI688_001887 [Linnemannia hyalina]|uniref:Extracellular membrane protein CFEM domain-containing protein n=1 Tax=Linnemannia hyalina TaxID=64524 RepID=A0A9P7XS31_9FUNG|nr:hypothetical protein KI688_001887 [Linnemannia hyalina]